MLGSLCILGKVNLRSDVSSMAVPARRPPLGRHISARQIRAGVKCKAATKPPSMQTSATELEWIQQFSYIVPDTMLFSEDSPIKAKAEATSIRLLTTIMDSTGGLANFKNDIMSASSWAASQESDPELQLNKWLDKAQVNIGSELVKDVEGRISTEIDARLSDDQEALVQRALGVMELYKEAGVPSDRVLMRVPATWDGIQAAGVLEKEGVQVHCTAVYSYAQAVLAARAGVSVISVNLRATQDEYNLLPGLIKDPKGPREDSGASSGVDPGIRLVASIYAMLQQTGSDTKLLVSGVRSAEDAMQLAGCDYLVLSDRIIRKLAGNPTLEGYNTGLSSEQLSEEQVPDMIKSKDDPVKPVIEVDGTKAAFKEEIGVAADDLLTKAIGRLTADVERARTARQELATGQE